MKKELSCLDTIKAIDDIKKYFERQLEARLSLTKVQCPLFVKSDSGFQDSLTGVEKGVSFIKEKEKNKLLTIVEDRINILNSIDDNSDNYYQQLKEIISEINKLELMIAKSEDDIKRYEDFTSNERKKASM